MRDRDIADIGIRDRGTVYPYMGIRDRVRGRCATRRQRMTFCLHFLPSCIPPRYLQVVVLVVLVVWARGRRTTEVSR